MTAADLHPTPLSALRIGDVITWHGYPADVLGVRQMRGTGRVSVLVQWWPPEWWSGEGDEVVLAVRCGVEVLRGLG